jgi:hypothetical protein
MASGDKDKIAINEIAKKIKDELNKSGIELKPESIETLIASREKKCGSCWSIGCKEGCDKGCLEACKTGKK